MAPPGRAWIEGLDEEDRAFLKRLLLASGSLKEVAEAYGVSYPTVRRRLDRLIAKVRVLDSQEVRGPFERQLRVEFAQGHLPAATFHALLAAYREENDGSDEQAPAGV